MSRKRVLLIDGDILIYKIATMNEVSTHWGDGLWTLHCDLNVCKNDVENEIEKLGADLEADDYIMALTDTHNFRKDVMPTYKANRKDKRKPMVLNALRDYVMEKLNGVIYKNLEADDVLGIMATEPTEEERIIVSIDKDLKQIPASLSVDGVTFNQVPLRLADYWFMLQTMAGDSVDGYTGIPTVGIKTAEKLISQYTNVPILELWKIVIKCFADKGLHKEEALQQARVARILRHGEYNKQTGEVKLWQTK